MHPIIIVLALIVLFIMWLFSHLEILIIVIIAVSSIVYFFIPTWKYNKTIKSFSNFKKQLPPGSRVTSESNALNEYRELIHGNKLMSPNILNIVLEQLFNHYRNKYKWRSYFIKKQTVTLEHKYNLTLSNKTRQLTYNWTWNILCEFNPEFERSLMNDKIRQYIKKRDNYTCQHCGLKNQVWHIDHIKPISKGGKTEYSNLQLLCSYCNLSKGNSFIG